MVLLTFRRRFRSRIRGCTGVLLMTITLTSHGSKAGESEIYPESGLKVGRSPASVSTAMISNCSHKVRRIDRYAGSDGQGIYRALASPEGIHGFEFEQAVAGPIRSKMENGEDLEEKLSPSLGWTFRFSETTAPLRLTEWPLRVERDKDGDPDALYESIEVQTRDLWIFPRKIVPTIRKSGNVLYVTLPSGETAEFNASTKKILAGVFTEETRTTRAPGQGSKVTTEELLFPSFGVTYKGKGVTAEAVGDQAVIRSYAGQNFQECSVPLEDVFKNAQTRQPAAATEGPPCRVLRFVNDHEFDRFLTERCSFSLKASPGSTK